MTDSTTTTFTLDVRELPAGAGRCIRVARWVNADGEAVRFAVTAGYESDRECWERVDRGCEIPPRLAAEVAAVLAELAGS